MASHTLKLLAAAKLATKLLSLSLMQTAHVPVAAAWSTM